MDREINIKLNEAVHVFEVVEKLQKFLHQPANYLNIEAFAKEIYPELKDVYHNIIWDWLPDDVKAELEER